METLERLMLALAVLGPLVMLGYWVRNALARRMARGRRAVRGRVVSSVRRELRNNRAIHFEVETRFETPGGRVLKHWRGFETEGQALLFSRLHKQGSEHPVVPNELEADMVFLAKELGLLDRYQLYLLWIALLTLGGGIYAVVEYFRE